MTLASMKEWLAHWGDGPNWISPTGEMIPVARASLSKLIADAERMQAALVEIRERALCHAPASVREFAPATAASLAIICEAALEGT